MKDEMCYVNFISSPMPARPQGHQRTLATCPVRLMGPVEKAEKQLGQIYGETFWIDKKGWSAEDYRGHIRRMKRSIAKKTGD